MTLYELVKQLFSGYNDKHLRSTTVLFGDGHYTITCFSKLLQKMYLFTVSYESFCPCCVIIIIGVMRVRLPSLVMLNLDWTCVTELSSLQYLRENGEAYRISFSPGFKIIFQCMHV